MSLIGTAKPFVKVLLLRFFLLVYMNIKFEMMKRNKRGGEEERLNN